MRRTTLAAFLTLAPLPVAPAQIEAPPGFELRELPYPGATFTSATATLSTGEIVVFDGLLVSLFSADGTLIRQSSPLSSFVYPSFVVPDPSESFAVLGESSTGTLLRVSLRSVALVPQTILVLPLNYDAVFEDDEHLLVSAATCGFSCANRIWRVDLESSTATLLARVAGASGPVALDGPGNLYYGTATSAFPPPPDSSFVLRWDAALLSSSGMLDESDATLVGGGFAGAAGLAIDPARGAIFLSENNYATGENRIRRVRGSADSSPVVHEGPPFFSVGNLAFQAGPGEAAFLPFQPASGGALRFTRTDFSTSVRRFELVPRRPGLTLGGPGLSGAGPFELRVSGGPPGGFARVFYCPRSLFHANESVIHLAGIPLFIGLDLPTTGSLPALLHLDAQGDASRVYTNPGGLEGLFAVQVLLLGPDLVVAGTSSSAFL